MAENILNVEDLKVRFYTYEGVVEAIDGANLSLRKNETLGLVGETGCGKSVTSLSVLVLVPPPGKIEGGNVTLKTQKGESVNLLEEKEDKLRRIRGDDISLIFQDPRSALNPVFTVEDQIREVLLHHRQKEFVKAALKEIEKDLQKAGSYKRFVLGYEKRIYKKMLDKPNALSLKILSRIPIANRYKRAIIREMRKDIAQILKTMRIPDAERVLDMYPHELSGGMAQRVVIAMSLACNPELLIADEPTTNLDVTIQAQILELIKQLKGKFGSSVLYITHDLGVVAELCDRVAVMYAGVVCELADVAEIFKNPLHPYTQALLESIPDPGKEFKSIPGEVPSLINPPLGCRFNPRCSKATDMCAQEKPRFLEVEDNHFVMCHLYRGKS